MYMVCLKSRGLTKNFCTDQFRLLNMAWQCLDDTETYHGIVAINVDSDLAERFLDYRETASDVKMTVQLDCTGTETSKHEISFSWSQAFSMSSSRLLQGI